MAKSAHSPAELLEVGDNSKIYEHVPPRFRIIEKLGRGTYAKVYSAVDEQNNGQIVALKVARPTDSSEGVSSWGLRETAILKYLGQHPHIISLYDVVLEDGQPCLAMELYTMSLRDLLHSSSSRPALEEDLIQSYTYQALAGLAYCHSRDVMHRDLSSANLLINEEGQLKLCDFGMAFFGNPLGRSLQTCICTVPYRAPEILLGRRQYDSSVDLWSVGVVLLEMYLGNPCFLANTEIGVIAAIFKLLGTPTEETWPGCTQLPFWPACLQPFPSGAPFNIPGISSGAEDLARDLLCCNPGQRLTAQDALKHSYVIGGTREWNANSTNPVEDSDT